MSGEDGLDGVRVVPVRNEDIGRDDGLDALRLGDGRELARRPVALEGLAHRAVVPEDPVGPAVVVALEEQHLLAARGGSGYPQRGLDGFRAGHVEPHLLRAGDHRHDPLRRLDLEVRLAGIDQAAIELRFDRVDHWARRVPEEERPVREHVVDQLVAVDVEEMRSVGVIEEQRPGLLGETDVAMDAARNRLLRALEAAARRFERQAGGRAGSGFTGHCSAVLRRARASPLPARQRY
jgi:hypothetical protein